jgi:hypothetical protein
MKPSLAEAIKARAQENIAKSYEELKVQLDRIEAKLDQALGLRAPEGLTPPVTDETPAPDKGKRK